MFNDVPDEDLEILHNLELALVTVYRAHLEMTDWQALEAVNGLIRFYQAQKQGRTAPNLKLDPLMQETFDRVQMVCEFHLGNATILTESVQPAAAPFQRVTIEELIAYLKRVRRSIETWNKELGRRGYYDFVNSYV